jgi:hypothetical protein
MCLVTIKKEIINFKKIIIIAFIYTRIYCKLIYKIINKENIITTKDP